MVSITIFLVDPIESNDGKGGFIIPVVNGK